MDTQQIIQELARADSAAPIPLQSFNDDDWYIYETDFLMFVRSCSASWRRSEVEKILKPGQSCARGMRAKWLGLWRYAA